MLWTYFLSQLGLLFSSLSLLLHVDLLLLAQLLLDG